MHIEVNDDDRSRVWYPLSLSLNNCERWRSDFDGPDIVMNLPSGVARDTLVQSWVRTRSRKTSLQDEFPRVVKNTPGSPSFGCCLDSCSEGRVSHERERESSADFRKECVSHDVSKEEDLAQFLRTLE